MTPSGRRLELALSRVRDLTEIYMVTERQLRAAREELKAARDHVIDEEVARQAAQPAPVGARV